MKILKHGFIVFFTFCFFTLAISYVMSLRSFASWNNLMINTNSNASTFALPRSSIASIKNTVNYSSTELYVRLINDESGMTEYVFPRISDTGHYQYYIPEGYVCDALGWVLKKGALPSPGNYRFQLDCSSDVSVEFLSMSFFTEKTKNNVTSESLNQSLTYVTEQFSGDVYIDCVIKLGSIDFARLVGRLEELLYPGSVVAGVVKFAFTESDEEPQFVSVGANTSNGDYQYDVSSSLSDLSSSVDEVSDEIGFVAEAIQNLQGAMEPHYNNVLTQLHHITEQLHAFYDQVYNNIHLAQMNMLSQIKEAIENIDLEVNISLDGLKQTIQQVGQNVITNDNKISADQIANDEANTEEVKDAVKEHGNFIIDGLKGLFIPSDEFFKAYFDDLYLYFSDRFGFLSFPIDLLVRTVNLFINSSDVDAVLTLPSFEISGEQVWADQSFNFTEFVETNFAFLLAAIRTVTSIGMIYAFVNLCQDKWDEVMKS